MHITTLGLVDVFRGCPIWSCISFRVIGFVVAKSRSAEHLFKLPPPTNPIPFFESLRCIHSIFYSRANFKISGFPNPPSLLSWEKSHPLCLERFQFVYRVRVSLKHLSRWHLSLMTDKLVFVVGQISSMDAKVIQSGCELFYSSSSLSLLDTWFILSGGWGWKKTCTAITQPFPPQDLIEFRPLYHPQCRLHQ